MTIAPTNQSWIRNIPPAFTGWFPRSAVLGAVLLIPFSLRAQTASEVQTATGITQGLAVHAGLADGELACALAQDGRMLVHGLAVDGATLGKARADAMAKGLNGLVTVEKAWRWSRLPYASEQVNLLVADLDALGSKGLKEEEILRVLVPKGAAYLKKSGSWKMVRKPWDEGLGSWTHWHGNAQGTSIIQDRYLRPPTSLKWVAGTQHMLKMRMDTPTGFRIDDGVATYEHKNDPMTENARSGVQRIARDAFNGLPLWKEQDEYNQSKTMFHMELESRRFCTGEGQAYFFPRSDDYAVARDLRTGAVTRTYTAGVKLEVLPQYADVSNANAPRGTVEPQELVYAGGYLVQTGGNRLVVLKASSGALVWEHKEPEKIFVQRPVFSPDNKRLFIITTYNGIQGARWPLAEIKDVVAFEAATGKLLWRCTGLDTVADFSWLKDDKITATFKTRYRIGLVAYSNGYIALAGPEPLGWGIGRSERVTAAAAVRAEDGKLLWKTMGQNYFYTMLARGDSMYLSGSAKVTVIPLATGKLDEKEYERNGQTWGGSYKNGYNGRCNRASGTQDYLVTGLSTYWDRDGGWSYSGISRSACATGSFLGHGMVFFTAAGCGCISQPHPGYQALRFEPVEPAFADAGRLEKGAAVPGAGKAAQMLSAKGLVPAEWTSTNAAHYVREATDPVQAGGLTLVAKVNEHRLEARRGSELVWSFVAGGRISMTPVVNGDLVIFGSHDGWVYAVKVADGSPAWRFLAAPTDKKIVAHGQIESAWPVFSVTLAGGNAVFPAGRHSELDGGIWVWGVDAVTGEFRWKRRVVTQVYVVPPKYGTDKRGVIATDREGQVYNTGDLAQLGINPAQPANRELLSFKPGEGRSLAGIMGDMKLLADLGDLPASPVNMRGKPASKPLDALPQLHFLRFTGKTLRFLVKTPGGHRVRLLDARQRVLLEARGSGSQIHQTGNEHLPAGVYYLHVESGRSLVHPFRILE